MKNVRFAQVVEKSGAPEPYLVLMDPKKDRTLRVAVKAQRVMTVMQETVGAKADRGEVGFHPGPHRQFLVFPKSLRAFANRAVIGIKYELLSSTDVPKSKRASSPRPLKKSKPKATPPAKVRREKTPDASSNSKVVAFRPPAEAEDEDEEVAELKKQVRHAMKVLEEGKAVAAFNLLKRIVGG